MNYLSVCAGIETASVAWGPLGWKPWAVSQFDPDHDYSKGVLDFPSTVIAHHYPGVLNLGDMTRYEEWPDVPNLNVLIGGTPCQTFSIAGLRAGLDDPRGNLMLTYAAIARRYRPAWAVWENVYGVLSDDGGLSFASLLGLLSGQRIEVPPGGWRTAGIVPGYKNAYGLAWRVLDTQFVRVDGFPRAIPQRRRRVFVVGYLGDWRRAAAVLFERAGLLGHPPPRRQAGQTVAGTLSRGFGVRGGTDNAERGTILPVAPTLRAGGNSTGGDRPPGTDVDTVESLIPVAGTLSAGRSRGAGTPPEMLVPEVANPLTARMHKGVNTTMDEGQTMVAFNARQDPVHGDTVGALDGDGFSHAVAFKASHYTRGKDGKPADVAFALSADADKGDQDMLILAPDVAATLTRGAESAGKGGYAGRRQEDDSNIVAEPMVFQPRFARNDRGAPDTVASALTAEAGSTGKGDSAQCVVEPAGRGWRVRRLMPVECERLQGLPDGYTDVPWRGKPAADGPRYKACGNGFSANAIRWIGRRIEMVEGMA